jgi:hypothetical protein
LNLKIRDLLKNFETLRIAYVKAWKTGTNAICKELSEKMGKIAEELRSLGIAIGMTPENLQYLQSSLTTCMRSATTPATVACLLRDVEGVFEVYEQHDEDKKITFRGFDKYIVEPDGTLSLPERQEEEKVELPDHPQTRNIDLEKRRSEKK